MKLCGLERVDLISDQACKGTPLELMPVTDRLRWYDLDERCGKKLMLVDKGGQVQARHTGDFNFEIVSMPSMQRERLQQLLEAYGYQVAMS